MSTSTRPARDRFFDSILDRQAAMFDLIRSRNERLHRFNRSLIEGARQQTRDWVEVSRRWATNPTDLIGLYEAVGEALGNSQARVLALSREWLEDEVESQRETREVVRQSFGDVRDVVERAQERAPSFLRRRVFVRSDGESPEPAEAQ
jgi:hypothetical protein